MTEQGPPKKTLGDAAHVVVKGALSAVPVAGGPLAELFAYLVAEPIAKRRDQWINEIAGKLRELEERAEQPLIEKLKDDPSFTTVLLDASQIAMRNHQAEKITALRNAVLNAALGEMPDDIERSIVLALIDRLTPAHVAVLSLMQEPTKHKAVVAYTANLMMGGLAQVITAGVPSLAGRNELVEVIWRDLTEAGLLAASGLNATMSGRGLTEKRTTPFGDRFLKFISDPLAE